MRFSVLSSGSRANCTFLEVGGTRLLIDCGLSARQAEIRLQRLGIPVDSIDAIVVTHEHSDHICGIPSFSRRHKLPVYANAATASFLEGCYGIEHFGGDSPFSLGEASITPVPVVHDALDPVGFVVEGGGFKFAQITDLGRVTPLVRERIRGANALVLESNHDREMLMSCSYPWELKQRISSSHGHLSNEACAELLAETTHGDLWHIVLAHLSENSNTPDLAMRAVCARLNPADYATCLCAGRRSETELISIEPTVYKMVAHD